MIFAGVVRSYLHYPCTKHGSFASMFVFHESNGKNVTLNLNSNYQSLSLHLFLSSCLDNKDYGEGGAVCNKQEETCARVLLTPCPEAPEPNIVCQSSGWQTATKQQRCQEESQRANTQTSLTSTAHTPVRLGSSSG